MVLRDPAMLGEAAPPLRSRGVKPVLAMAITLTVIVAVATAAHTIWPL